MEGKITFIEKVLNQDGTEFQDRNKNSYFNVDVDNGAETIQGYVCAKTQWFKEGETIAYALEERKGKKDRWQWRLHFEKPQPQQQNLLIQEKDYDLAALYRAPEKALESAVVSFSGQSATTEKILDRAEFNFNWIKTKVEKLKEELK